MTPEQKAAVAAVQAAMEKSDDVAMAAMIRACQEQFLAAFN